MSRKMDSAYEAARRRRADAAPGKEEYAASARELHRQAKLAVEAWDCPDPKLASSLKRTYGLTNK